MSTFEELKSLSEKFKNQDEKNKKILFWILIFLIATTSFGLGYMVAKEKNIAPIIIQKTP